jgi:hypothetical protein
MASNQQQQRVICVQIERPPVDDEETQEQRLERISQCLQKAEDALESGDISGFFDFFKTAAKTVMDKTKEAAKAAANKAVDMYKRRQDKKSGSETDEKQAKNTETKVQGMPTVYKVDIPERFFGEMDALVSFMDRIVRKLEQMDSPAKPSYPPPQPPRYYPPPPPPSAREYYPPPPPPEYYLPPPPSAPEYYPPPPPGYYAPSAPPYQNEMNPAATHPPPHAGHPMYYLVRNA